MKLKEHYRKLIWTPDGYKPVGAENWVDYRPSTNPYVIRHDLYHHQPNETGTWEEELRACGGTYRFKRDYERLSQSTDFCFKRIGEHKFDAVKKGTDLMIDWIRFDNEWSSKESWNYYYNNLVYEGYNNALKYSEEAHEKMLTQNFVANHKAYKNIVVDLNKGIIVKTSNSREAVEYIKQRDEHSSIQEKKIAERELREEQIQTQKWEKKLGSGSNLIKNARLNGFG